MIAISENVSNKPIIAGVDGSPFSAAALRWALADAARRHCPVIALMTWHADLTILAGRPTMVGLPPLLHSTPDAAFQQLLDGTVRHALAGHDGPAVPVTTRLVQGSAADCLVAASPEANLLVLGSHGHGRMFNAIMGSVAQHCIRHAACPVLIVPARLAEKADVPAETAIASDAPAPLHYALRPSL
jgi:nucleotide-binding universal stress UspA family protein